MAPDNETWLLEFGDQIINKKADGGYSNLTEKEKLGYCCWILDYGMRNAGSREVFQDFGTNFAQDLLRLSKAFGLNDIVQVLALRNEDEAVGLYHKIFEPECTKLRLLATKQ